MVFHSCSTASWPFYCAILIFLMKYISIVQARRAGSDGSMSASGSAGPGFNPRWGSKFYFENFQPRG